MTDIPDLDLSALDIHTVRHGATVLKAVRALSLEPRMDETSQLLCVEHGDLALDVFAPTREALLAELSEQIAMLWTEYALAEDDTLDAVARKLKHALLVTFTDVRDAA